MSVGSTTVRITEAAARELRDALTRAFVGVDTRQSPAPTPIMHLVSSRGDEDPEDGGPQFH